MEYWTILSSVHNAVEGDFLETSLYSNIVFVIQIRNEKNDRISCFKETVRFWLARKCP